MIHIIIALSHFLKRKNCRTVKDASIFKELKNKNIKISDIIWDNKEIELFIGTFLIGKPVNE